MNNIRRLLKSALGTSGIFLLLFFVGITIAGLFWTPHDPFEINYAKMFLPPGTPGHLLGTDALGRDLLSRILYGARFTFLIGATLAGISVLIGTILGVTCGYVGGLYDMLVSRLLDVTLAMPDIVIALAIATALKPGLISILVSVGAIGWRDFARLARGETLRCK
jgi:peptide/nickel transport system permease protein